MFLEPEQKWHLMHLAWQGAGEISTPVPDSIATIRPHQRRVGFWKPHLRHCSKYSVWSPAGCLRISINAFTSSSLPVIESSHTYHIHLWWFRWQDWEVLRCKVSLLHICTLNTICVTILRVHFCYLISWKVPFWSWNEVARRATPSSSLHFIISVHGLLFSLGQNAEDKVRYVTSLLLISLAYRRLGFTCPHCSVVSLNTLKGQFT